MQHSRSFLSKGSGNFKNAAWVDATDEGVHAVEVGNILDPDDGELRCVDNGDQLIALKNLGYTSINDFTKEFFPVTGSGANCDGDNCKHIGLKDMRDKIQEHIRKEKFEGPDNQVNTLSSAAKYWFYDYHRQSECGGKAYEKKSDAGFDSAPEAKKNEAGDEKIDAWVILYSDLTKTHERHYFTFKIEDDNGLEELGFKLDTSPYSADYGQTMQAFNCIEIANHLDKGEADAYLNMINAAIVTCVDGGGDKAGCQQAQAAAATPSAGEDTSCEAQGGILSWLSCPALDMVGGILNWVDTQLNRLLEVNRDQFASDQMYLAWSRFRNIALSLVIAAILVMVISTALGIGALDAYTVKKSFPRLVMSIMFILLSWYVCLFFIDMSNIIGRGTLGLITAPFGVQAQSLTTLFDPSVGGAIIQFGGLGIGAAVLLTIPGAVGILLSWMGTGLLIMALAFIILIARQMFIIVLILFSPIAILSWIFPNNNKLWKFWWESFSKLLLMYPMIMALIGSGRVFASVIAQTPAAGAQGSLLSPILKLTAYIIPYAFIPLTFKAAGGIFGNLVGMANDRSKGVFDRLKKSRQGNYKKAGAYTTQQRANAAGWLSKRGSTVDASEDSKNFVRNRDGSFKLDNNGNRIEKRRSRYGRGATRLAGRALGAGGIEEKMSAQQAEWAKFVNDAIATGRDGQFRGLSVDRKAIEEMGGFEAAMASGLTRYGDNGERQFKTLGGDWVNESDVNEAHSRFGKNQFVQQAVLSYEQRKAMESGQIEGLKERYAHLATSDWGLSDRQAGGAWIGASFENQNQHIELKNTDWKTGATNGNKLATEVYEKKGSYPLSQMSGHTIEQLMDSYDEAGVAIVNSQAILASEGASDAEKAEAQATIVTAQDTQAKLKAVSLTFVQRGSTGGQQLGMAEGEIPVNAQPTIVEPGADGTAPQRVAQTFGSGPASVNEKLNLFAFKTGALTEPPPGPPNTPVATRTVQVNGGTPFEVPIPNRPVPGTSQSEGPPPGTPTPT